MSATKPIKPIYTPENTRSSYHIKWSLSLFWHNPPLPEDLWLPELTTHQKTNNIFIENHTFSQQNTSLFTINTFPSCSPQNLVKRIKGNLQTIIRKSQPKAFQRNFFIRSIGKNTRENVENYISKQIGHHKMADERVQKRLEKYQIDNKLDLSKSRNSSHGLYIYNLHLVFVRDGRWHEIDDSVLTQNRDIIVKSAAKKGHLLSNVGIFPDHFHLCIGCNIGESPEDVALSYMNNLSYSQGMNAIFQYSYYVETISEYNKWAIL